MNSQMVLLRARLALAAVGPVLCAAAVLLVAGAVALSWLLPQRALQSKQQAVALAVAAHVPLVQAPPPATANENLALFYDTLGEKRYAEQQVRTLFGLAAKSGLTLNQGEYKAAFDANGRFTTYQITLPVKGSYRAIWQFAMLSLRAIPFASLDDISFRRDAIGDPNVEAHLRITLYLADQGGAPR